MSAGLPLLRLMQLVSPALPIGMYSYSQGQEKAVEDGWLADEAALAEWLEGLLEACLARTDLPVLARLYDAWKEDDGERVAHWSAILGACRETEELRLEDRQTGQALARVLGGLGVTRAEDWIRHPQACLATLFALAGVTWSISRADVLTGYGWGWLENQVLCAIKLVPLGQTAGQRLLIRIAARIPQAVAQAANLSDEEIGGSSPLLAIAGSRHAFQYSRLFRS
ncbi:urease accessory protein UreF [Methylococcus sp. EFPC2]|nr:urease accessory protein UreF [Methylococcus sp. EFPC2]